MATTPLTGLTFDDVLLIPTYNHYESRRDVDISMKDRTGKLHLQLPVLTANMDTITENEMAQYMGSKGGMGVLHRFCSIEKNIEMFRKIQYPTFVSVGCSEKELERVEALKAVGASYFCVDVAHGHARYVGRMIKRMRELLPNECILAGNVATYAGADYLSSVGADIIKVGIGPGAVCTTRIKTGFGVAQLTAIQECSRIDRSIVADGGLRYAGDIVKALAFGADFVMVGSMLAGTEPTPGEPIEVQEPTLAGSVTRQYKIYRGMASKEVADDYHGGLAEWKTAEGVSTRVPYRNDQDTILADIIGGIRSGLTYGGSSTIRELQRKLHYQVITPATQKESLPHRLLTV